MSIQAGTNAPKFYSQIRRKGGGTIDQIDATVAVNQTINKGDFLVLSSNKVAQALTLPAANAASVSGASPALYGIAMQSIATNASGVALDGSGRTTIPIALLNEDTEVMVGIVAGTTNVSANGATSRQADVNIGGASHYALARATGPTTATWGYMMSTTTTNGCLNVVEYSIESSNTESFGFVWVNVMSTGRVAA